MTPVPATPPSGVGWYHRRMKVVIFGATGRTGRLLVEGALARGHEVTAFVRAPDKLGALRERVSVVRGDVLDGGAVSDAVDGQDAALVALGSDGTRAAVQVNARGTLNVIRSMQRYGARRLVVLSATGDAAGPRPQPAVVPRPCRQTAVLEERLRRSAAHGDQRASERAGLDPGASSATGRRARPRHVSSWARPLFAGRPEDRARRRCRVHAGRARTPRQHRARARDRLLIRACRAWPASFRPRRWP